VTAVVAHAQELAARTDPHQPTNAAVIIDAQNNLADA
jgi:hypothetical protein